ncbi:hypothetical protein [Edaphobacter sp. DSM 109919]|uniref:Uncharacterized protein n=1 Tax=Edaphobacter paludis TaxID=3035702 RepID=A0AAU7CUZ8_9BACT
MIRSSRSPRMPFQTIDKILSPDIYERLSPYARKVYSGVWNSANWRGTNPIWLKDDEVAERAKVPMSAMNTIQSDLVKAGLLHIVPGSFDTQYEILDIDQ